MVSLGDVITPPRKKKKRLAERALMLSKLKVGKGYMNLIIKGFTYACSLLASKFRAIIFRHSSAGNSLHHFLLFSCPG